MAYEIEAEILHSFSANDLRGEAYEVLLPVVTGQELFLCHLTTRNARMVN